MTPERFIHYITGIPSIDADHFAMLVEATEIGRLVKNKKYNDARVLLNLMCHNLQIHLKKEEEFLRAINYSYIDFHIVDHNTMINILQKVDIFQLTGALEITGFTHKIEMLLINHIDNYDLQFAPEAKLYPELFNKYHLSFRDLTKRRKISASWKIRSILERHRSSFTFYNLGLKIRPGKFRRKNTLV